MSNQLYNLVIVAHPDDETIYFSAPLLKDRSHPWKVICITNGDADGKGKTRLIEFEKACQMLKVDHFERWDYPDLYDQRIDVDKLCKDLNELEAPLKLYTHGVVGEYGHPHHQDISYAAHKVFSNISQVFSVSYNTFPDQVLKLSQEEYNLKTDILSGVYADEINKFAHLVPATAIDSYSIVSLKEVELIYNFLTKSTPLSEDDLDKYKWLYNHITKTLNNPSKRLF